MVTVLDTNPQPHPCSGCRRSIRTVPYGRNAVVTIDAEPAPDGYVVPWPAMDPFGMAEAKFVEGDAYPDPKWRLHVCI